VIFDVIVFALAAFVLFRDLSRKMHDETIPYKSVEILTNFQYEASLHNREASLMNTFWRRFWAD